MNPTTMSLQTLKNPDKNKRNASIIHMLSDIWFWELL